MKRKRINKRLLYVILSIIVVSVLSLTLAYAVLSSNLTISGSSEISGSSWNITLSKFDYQNNNDLTEEQIQSNNAKIFYNGFTYGKAELLNEPVIFGTTLRELQLSFITPGDTIGLYYSLTNSGTIPAKIESIVQNTPSFSSSTNNADDVELVSKGFLSSIALYPNTKFLFADALDVGYILCPGETIYFEFGSLFLANSLSSSNITVSNLGGTINFVQADKSLCAS